VTFSVRECIFSLFLDRTVAARWPEKPAESATGIIPGNRGKESGNWCRPPLDGASRPRHISPVPLDGVAAVPVMRQRSCAVRRDFRNRVQPSQVQGQFRALSPMQLPRGLWLLLYNQDAAKCSRWVHPTKRPGPQGGARKGRGAAGSGRVWQSSQNLLIGAARKTASPNCKSKAT
jgi:hypothetical protein